MSYTHHSRLLQDLARQAMIDRGLEPDYPQAAVRQVEALKGPAEIADARDLRHLLWCSIDNDDSRDLDQLTAADGSETGPVRIQVAIADVDALIHKGTPVDDHARLNTTSVYTPARIFAMLPERLSTDLTSLNAETDRMAVVVDYVVQPDGSLGHSEIYRAQVRNKAKLAYNGVAAWLNGDAPLPPAGAAVPGLDEQLRVQDRAAAVLRRRRHQCGALGLETVEARAVVQDDAVVDLQQVDANRAHALIEDLMIAANGVAARFLDTTGFPSLRRVVRTPQRWDRICDVARQYGEHLPGEPDAVALEQFLQRRRAADPLRFPDLSLTIIKLLGPGEYVVKFPGEASDGHFSLAVRDYTHSTAPNRRFPDDITQRMLKAALGGERLAYDRDELLELAEHCTRQEDAARKVERQTTKSAAAMLLSSRVGQVFDGLVTGAGLKGTWVRTFHPPVEGMLVRGKGVDVGDRVRVRLLDVNVERGFIDFALA